ncbi:MAG: chorismate synthase [Oscillospiraceae bacterium]|jgi:chorismate synthase|nr:chorismate synthase [Oscillospiraceae bacterium]
MSNAFGENIRLTIFGQSHAPSIGAVIEGLPPGFAIDWEAVQAWLDRRAPGRDALSTARREQDIPRVISGLNARGETCGAPLCAVIDNKDARSCDYDELLYKPRPGHADYPAYIKTGGANDPRGGGAFSGRMTAPLCLAGAICAQILARSGIRTGARIAACAGVEDIPRKPDIIDEQTIAALSGKRFPTLDDGAGERMRGAILRAAAERDSVGGVIEAFALNVPPGWGDPMFGGLENRISQAVFAIPAVRGVAFGAGAGSGFGAANLKGSEHNDEYIIDTSNETSAAVRTRTNRHGGILGGISTGMPIVFEVAIKPTPSIGLPQQTVDLKYMASVGHSPASFVAEGQSPALKQTTLLISGRHDPCIVPRAVPCVEAALALALADAACASDKIKW